MWDKMPDEQKREAREKWESMSDSEKQEAVKRIENQ
jgi:predicted Fe-S protein YdhL (DUF1289 family)